MLPRLILLFILVPLAELALLLAIADWTDWRFTLALVILTGIFGAWLARREGLRCLQGVQRELEQGRLPADALLDGLMILVAGTLLITPGVLTDLIGFGLLVRPLRARLRRCLVRRIKTRITIASMPGRPNPFTPRDDVIDVESRPADDQQQT